MIKRTLYFGNPAYLKTRLNQLIIEQEDKEISLPIEDIGVVKLDYKVDLTKAIKTEKGY